LVAIEPATSTGGTVRALLLHAVRLPISIPRYVADVAPKMKIKTYDERLANRQGRLLTHFELLADQPGQDLYEIGTFTAHTVSDKRRGPTRDGTVKTDLYAPGPGFYLAVQTLVQGTGQYRVVAAGLEVESVAYLLVLSRIETPGDDVADFIEEAGAAGAFAYEFAQTP
jgi:hypothetical protein